MQNAQCEQRWSFVSDWKGQVFVIPTHMWCSIAHAHVSWFVVCVEYNCMLINQGCQCFHSSFVTYAGSFTDLGGHLVYWCVFDRDANATKVWWWRCVFLFFGNRKSFSKGGKFKTIGLFMCHRTNPNIQSIWKINEEPSHHQIIFNQQTTTGPSSASALICTHLHSLHSSALTCISILTKTWNSNSFPLFSWHKLSHLQLSHLEIQALVLPPLDHPLAWMRSLLLKNLRKHSLRTWPNHTKQRS